MDNKGVYIPSIDAKDIYLSAHYIEHNPDGYSLKLKDGQQNLRKFINSLDYSLDLIELLDIYYKKATIARVDGKGFHLSIFLSLPSFY